ncbi:MAG: dihydrolipoyl dehydrogenase [Deferrisomatales bacterium]|nr:dihydrolipoyl dehydrogenase [Deferrisomatales bacterium]
MAGPDFDLVVIGAGPGGYVAAARAAALGMKVACVEREERLGGVCLRVGCIPSKALLDSSELYAAARERLAEHGVGVGKVTLDLAALRARKDRVVAELTDGVRKLLERGGVEVVRGVGRLAGPASVEVSPGRGKKKAVLSGRAVLLATGSEPVDVGAFPADGKRIVTSTEALDFDAVPKRLGIVGGGYIGLELGSVWARLGSEVTVIEALPRVAATADGQVGRALERSLRKQGLSFRLKTRVVEAKASSRGVKAVLEDEGGKRETFSCDRLLVAVGRRPLTRGLGLGEAGIAPDPRTGRIPVDTSYRTRVPTVFAVGDLIDGPMLAHKASAEGVAAVEGLAGLPGEVSYDSIPSVIYTHPEAASVGLTEEQLKERGISYRSGTYPFGGNGRARCLGETEGFAKVLAHRASGRLLGVHIVGPRASDLIAEAVLAVELGVGAEALARTVHAHPTFPEVLMEAAAAAARSG